MGRIGFGAMGLAGRGCWGPPRDEAEARALLREAVELGVDFFDTADSYGPEVSERLIAEALHPYPDHVVIATKGGYVREGPWNIRPDGRPERLRAACEASLRRLRLDHIPLYQLHTVDSAVPLAESVGALAELRREGKIQHVGLSNVNEAQIEVARAIVPLVSVQNRYNLLDREGESVLRYCERTSLAFITWFPLAKGALAEARRLTLGRSDATPAQMALAWLLHTSPVTLAIPGTTSRAHLVENVAALALELSSEGLDQLGSARLPAASARRFVRGVARRTIGPIARPILKSLGR